MQWEKVKSGFKKFTHVRLRKMHLDYLAGLLTIPVLVTAIVLNWTNLARKAPTPSLPVASSPSPQVIVVPQTNTQASQQTTPTPTPACLKSVGPISITSPTEGESLSDNPVCITISYSDSSYCPVLWAYQINGGAWSSFTNTSPCLYNLPNGTITFNVKVNSTVSSDSQTLLRTFIYTGQHNPTSTPTPIKSGPTPVATSSAQ